MEGTALQSVDLTPLCNVANCKDLKSVTWAKPSKITEVGNLFFYNCSSLEAADLRGLTKAQTIGFGAFGNCTKLQSIDLTPLTNVKKVGDGFLKRVWTQPYTIVGGPLASCKDVRVPQEVC
eukprot:TRINITY_DN12158_c0_g1_i1.p1 TRINITY_DN12158_c0_g1~~TRINITY_DN12158_c0_g1_i1.p1  ORF type:complete len:121 (+),score=23.62 TRINITY_DN12158_c0_g1_i1:637-999(+)